MFAGWGQDAEACGTAVSCSLTVGSRMTVLALFDNAPTGPTVAPVATVTVTPPSSPLFPGNTHQMLVGLYDASGNALADRVVSWESSDPAVATVSPSGLVQALAVGTSTVTATSEGKTGSAVVLVIADGGGPGNLCQQIAGASVIAHDGQYLGRLTNEFDSESIYNEFGSYGSEFSQTSIYNEFGTYGSEFSAFSAFNEFASTPPVLIRDGNFLAYFTINQFKTPAVNPHFAETCRFF